MSAYAKLRTDLIAVEGEVDGQPVVTIKDPIRDTFFRLRQPEYWLISQLDGETSYEEIAARFKEKFQLNIDAEAVGQFAQVLEQNFFLENSRSEQAVSRKSYGVEKKKSLFSRLLFIKLKAFDPSKILDKLTKIYRPMHSWSGYLLQWGIIISGILLFMVNSRSFELNVYELLSVGSIIAIVAAFFIMVTIHEFAHAVACRLYGGQVKEMGFLLMYFQPCCYCNLSDAWLFPEKKKRLAVTWAGLYSGLILFALAMFVWRVTMPFSLVNEIARILIAVIVVTFMFNFNPLIKLDGYYLLSDWLEISNLRSKAFGYVGQLLEKYILSKEIDTSGYTGREKRIFLVYTLLAVVYTVLLLGFILYHVGLFLYDNWGVAGLSLLLVVLFYTLRQNIYAVVSGVGKYIWSFTEIMKKPVRLTIHLIIWIALIVLFFFVQFPHRVTGEITIQPIAEFSLLLNNLGLLEKKFQRGGVDAEIQSSYIQMTSLELGSLELIPNVKDGQKVGVGDTLAILTSNQVIREIESERSLLEKLQNDLALLRSPPKKEAVDEATAELQAAQAKYDRAVQDEARVRGLAEKQFIPDQELETAVANTKVAKAEVENKRAKLELLKSPPKPEEEAVIFSEIEKQKAKVAFLLNQQDAQSIVTPIAGRVVINHDQEQFLTIVDNSKVEVLVPVSDFDIELVWLDQPVKIKVRSYLDDVFEGEVVHVPQDASVKNDISNFMVSVVVENEEGRLQKGMTGYAKIEIGKTSLFNLLLRRIFSILRVEFWSWW